MKTKRPSGDILPPHEHPLYRAIKRLADDLRALFELASRKDEESWNNYISLAERGDSGAAVADAPRTGGDAPLQGPHTGGL